MNYHICRVILSSLCVVVFGADGFWWCSFSRLQKTSCTKNYNTQRTENNTTDVVIHQHSRKLLKIDILMSETCWAQNKWNKTASVIKLVFYSSTISKNSQISSFMKICPVEDEWFHADRRTDRHDETNSHSSQFCESAYKKGIIKEIKMEMDIQS